MNAADRIALLRRDIDDVVDKRDLREAAGRPGGGLLEQQWRLEDELGRLLFDEGLTFCGYCYRRFGSAARKEEDGIQCGTCGEVTEYRDLEESTGQGGDR